MFQWLSSQFFRRYTTQTPNRPSTLNIWCPSAKGTKIHPSITEDYPATILCCHRTRKAFSHPSLAIDIPWHSNLESNLICLAKNISSKLLSLQPKASLKSLGPQVATTSFRWKAWSSWNPWVAPLPFRVTRSSMTLNRNTSDRLQFLKLSPRVWRQSYSRRGRKHLNSRSPIR